MFEIIEVEWWLSSAEEIARGNRLLPVSELIPYWKNVRRPTVDRRIIQSYREWKDSTHG